MRLPHDLSFLIKESLMVLDEDIKLVRSRQNKRLLILSGSMKKARVTRSEYLNYKKNTV